MRKINYGVLSVLSVVAIVISGCTSPDADTTAYEFGLNLEPGMSWRVISTDMIEISWSQSGVAWATKGNEELTYSAEVRDVEPNGTVTIEATLIGVKIDVYIEIGGQAYTPHDIFGFNPDTQFARIIQDMSFQVIYKPDGTVEIPSDFSKVHQRIENEIDFGDQIEEAPQGDVLKQSILDDFIAGVSAKAFEMVFSDVFGLAPRDPVSVGDTWVRPEQAQELMHILVQESLTLIKTDERFAYMTSQSTVRPDPEHTAGRFLGESTGERTISLDTGILSGATTRYRLNGTLTTPEGISLSQSATIESRLEVFSD